MAFISALQLGSSVQNTGSWTGITVPANAKLAVLSCDGFSAGSTNPFTEQTGGALPTLGGSSMSCPDTGHLQDATDAAHQGGTFYLINPSTGSGKTLAWDWKNSIGFSSGDPGIYLLSFFDDAVSGVRAVGGQQANNTNFTAGSIAAQAGDLLIGCASLWARASVSWSGVAATSQATYADQGSSVFISSGTASGATTVSFTCTSTDGGIFAMAMIPAIVALPRTYQVTAGNA